jgi:isopenicillin N synthase-like dioxygenase
MNAQRTFHEVPVIDVSALVVADPDPDALDETVRRIGDACRDVGFLYVKNHGLPDGLSERMMEQTRAFFDLPLEEKMKLRLGQTSQFRGYVPMLAEVTATKRDYHECLDLQPLSGRDAETIAAAKSALAGRHPLDDPDQWPAALPEFRPVMMEAWTALTRLGEQLASGMALSLGLDAGFFQKYAGDELCDLRLSHYPPFQPDRSLDDVEFGMGAHVDYGFLAIVQQDGVDGLEVRNPEGEWINAPHIPGTLLVNIGLMMQRWSNDRYTATWHRVRFPGGRHRYSMPFFFEPAFDAVIAPLPECCSEDNPPRYEPVQFGTWVVEQFSTAYDNKEDQA